MAFLLIISGWDVEENSPESYFPVYKGRTRPKYKPSNAPSPFLPCFQHSSSTVVYGFKHQSSLLCSARSETPEDNSPASNFQLDSDNNKLYDAIRVGSQKRKAGQMSADSSASDLSVIFSPRKIAKSKTKIEELADELEPYQEILVNLQKDNERKHKKQIKQLIQNLRDKKFLQSSVVDVLAGEVCHPCINITENLLAIGSPVLPTHC
jgi:hypothetical protein